MPDRPADNDDESFDWLFGSREQPAASADPEPTQVLPLGGRPVSAYPGVPADRQGASATRYQPPYDPRGEHSASGTGQPTAYQPAVHQPSAQQSTVQQRWVPPQSPTRQPPPPGQAGARPAAPPPARRRRRWGRLLVVLLVAWMAFLVAVPIWAWSKIDKVNASPGGNRPADTPGTTYLLVGSDSRRGLDAEQRQRLATGNAAGQRTDTIMLLHVPDGSGPTLLLSLPRDSYVAIPGHSKNKINAAFSFGGPRLLVRTVELATGLRVDDYISIGFGGFVNIVDSVGGVQICPKAAMKDPKANLDIPKGCQRADGPTALGYVRSRYTDPLGDIGRAARQREVVSAVASKAASPLTVALPWRYVSLAGSGANAIQIGDDVGPLEVAKFAWAVSHVGTNGLTCTVPVDELGASSDVGSVVTWEKAAAAKLFKAVAADQTEEIDCSPNLG